MSGKSTFKLSNEQRKEVSVIMEQIDNSDYIEATLYTLISQRTEMAQLLLDVVHSPEQAWHSWLFKRDEVLKKAGLLQ